MPQVISSSYILPLTEMISGVLDWCRQACRGLIENSTRLAMRDRCSPAPDAYRSETVILVFQGLTD